MTLNTVTLPFFSIPLGVGDLSVIFHNTVSIVFQSETEVIQLGICTFPLEHYSKRAVMSNELDIAIIQEGLPLTSDGPRFLH